MMTSIISRLRSMDEFLSSLLALDKCQRFFHAHKNLLLYCLAVAMIAYGYDLFSFSMKIDSENHATFPGAKIPWLQQGRWGMYLLNYYLLPDDIMPFIPVLISLVGLSIGVLFFLLSLSDKRSVSDYLAAPLGIGCPLLAFAFYFTTLGYGLGVAFAVVGIGLYALTRWRWGGMMVAIACFTFGIGIYQAILLLILTLFGFYLVVSIITTAGLSFPMILRRLGIFLAVLTLSYGLYECIKTLTLLAYRIPYSQEYLQSYLRFGTDWAYISTTLSATFGVALKYYTGGDEFYLYPLPALSLLFYFSLALTILLILTAAQSLTVKLFGLLALAGSLCAPLLMHLLNAGDMPPRTLLGIPFVLISLVFSAACINSKIVKACLGLLVLACFFKFSVANNRYALASEMDWQADRELSVLILQRIHTVLHKLPSSHPPYPVELVGMFQAVETPIYTTRDVIGASFYYWSGGNTDRMTRLWRSMRQFAFRTASPVEKVAVVDTAVSMPAWPAQGSVDVVNGVIVVKIGDYSSSMIERVCRTPNTSAYCQQLYPAQQ